ncbi:helix-turn-helix domain-containing protein [Streptococcus hyointestinalis]|uniref:Repressor protein n=1 Tax=Streptococcus hyointestinalis TaxID=1337 RepID=A0A380KG72_9STRE|nr:helix-turn-helix transcriptional regulator [Streptococcus hyointestinalis]SUN63888.1 repressor protein [Streptococcus hyointestinalis]
MKNTVNKKAVGARIRKIRLEKGMTLEEFGKLMGADKGIVSRWENGTSVPKAERLKTVAKLGDMTVEELLNGSPRYDWDKVEENLRDSYSFTIAGDLYSIPFEEKIFSKLKNTLENIEDVTFSSDDILTFYQDCIERNIIITDYSSLISYLKERVEEYNDIIQGVSDFDEKEDTDTGLLSAILGSRNKYLTLLNKAEGKQKKPIAKAATGLDS